MKLPLNLTGEFYCYERRNVHGFFGEQRDMVLNDMTMAEAIAFHIKNWNFEPDFEARPIHDFSHQPLAIATIYEPKLERFRIEKDPETGFLKPQGYNGFLEGEFLAIGIQTILGKIINNSAVKSLFDILKHESAALTNKYYGDVFKQNDIDFWLIAEQSGEAQSLFEAKYHKQFLLRPRHYRNVEMYFNSANNNGEVLKKYKQPTDFEMMALANAIVELIDTIEQGVRSQGITRISKAVPLLYQMRIRDIHRLIGGDEPAKEYFRLCGVSEEEIKTAFSKSVTFPKGQNKKAAGLSAAL